MMRRAGQGVAAAALLIGGITILARVVGFAKQLVLARTVGTNCLATAYFTANQIPNLVFELVVGGALAGMVVPVVAGDRAAERVGWITSALLTWVMVVLVPLGVVTALVAGPLMELFAGNVAGCAPGELTAVAARMLVVFAPQIPLYGVAVVLYGVLQAHRRFAGPALAPLVSSVVVIVAYLVFVPLGQGATSPADVPRAGELVLSVGTTLGVLALVVTVLGPAARLGLPLRPVLRFPPGVAARVRALAAAGLGALIAQQVATAFVVWLANNRVGAGGVAGYTYAWAIYQVPYAVLAVPIATSAFPALSARAERGDDAGFAALTAATTRAVVLVGGLAAGALAAVAAPVAEVFVGGMASDVRADELARSIALFAPGLVGYGLVAHLSRVLYAAGRGRAAAVGTVAGWGVVMVAQAVLVAVLPEPWRLAGLGLGSTVGMTAAGALLAVPVLRGRGARALDGVPRALLAAVLAGAAGFLTGHWITSALTATGPWAGAAVAALAGLAAVAAGVAITAALSRRDLSMALSRLRGTASGPPDGPPGTAGTVPDDLGGPGGPPGGPGGSREGPEADDGPGGSRDGVGDDRGGSRDGSDDGRSGFRDGAGDDRGGSRDGAGDGRSGSRDGAGDGRGGFRGAGDGMGGGLERERSDAGG
ncbi:murein biosynthesis integral membrane protein MurJ [Sphaerisporangium aureirubrum]|uniref:Murein biosynthesis integral membrane protein MurJ n=1 Tax=Sphaerisporangium aureirubrum TaxID=1544736 RepID=A0ABW1NJ19_9ACTN